ncbi:MAG: hypothetical protein OEZ34_08490 [Spirochaetia bacterium]|nr:hypothetical protein [Spirochaetia bacterium]
MNNLSDKVKIVYLSLVVLFSMGVFIYFLDAWNIIRLHEYLPFLDKEPPIVEIDEDNPTELELQKIRKDQERLIEEEIRLKELSEKLEGEKAEMEQKLEEIQEMKQGLEEQVAMLEQTKVKEKNREKKVKAMAQRIYSMPPDDSVAIVAGWSNTDLVEVFVQMEKDAQQEGRQSIVPYLMTKLPRDRAAVITSLMLDEKIGMDETDQSL